MKNLPTAFQKNALWTAVTALALTVTVAISVGAIHLFTQVMGFLQPILVPFAIAGVLAYLLEPGVGWLEKKGLKRSRAVPAVFAVFLLAFLGLGWWLGAKIVHQTDGLGERIGVYAEKVRVSAVGFIERLEEHTGFDLMDAEPELEGETPSSSSAESASAPEVEVATEVSPAVEPEPAEPEAETAADLAEGGTAAGSLEDFDLVGLMTGDWVRSTLPALSKSGWNLIKSSLGGFLGAFGFLLSMIIVPLYLYYFLMESAKIKETWSDYLPLRASKFKDELVDCLNEINSYLIAFFRGQLFVSVINGVATGVGLAVIGLDFGVLIGLALCVLGIIPYLGIALCWIPAVVIGIFQDGGTWLPTEPWWVLPVAVCAIFALVQQIDALFITPRIVGESVGLHPMTVIVSVFAWSLFLGGLLGAILAVPLTASLKVLFRRYVWQARLAPQTVGGAKESDEVGVPSGG